jgi:hypothetical protein
MPPAPERVRSAYACTRYGDDRASAESARPTADRRGLDGAERVTFNSGRRYGAQYADYFLSCLSPFAVLDAVTGFFDLLSGLLYRLVDFLAGVLCRAFLLLAAG